MRLTLRNLLRFLDQADLKSAEQKKLRQLVEQSEKAESWIKRINSLRHDTSVLSSAINDTEAPDMNHVAAYLDMKMDETETNEFEAILFSSDQLLAEVASCHEVRSALGLDEPSAVPIELRQRIYDLDRDDDRVDIEQQPAASDSFDALASSMRDLPFVDRTPEQDLASQTDTEFAAEGFEDQTADSQYVPIDQLTRRANRRSRLTALSIFVLLIGLIAVAFWLGRQSADRSPTGTVGSKPDSADVDTPSPKTSSADEPGQPETAVAAKKSEEPASSDESTKQLTEVPALVDQPPPPPAMEKVADADELPQKPEIHMPEAEIVQSGDDAAETVIAPPDADLPVVANLGQAESTLFRLDPECNGWFRQSTDAPIRSESELIVLNQSTATLAFGDSFLMTAVGPARFRVGWSDDSEAAWIEPLLGKFAFRNQQVATSCGIRLGKSEGQLLMPAPDTEIELERAFYCPSGSNPVSDAVHDYFTVIARGGSCQWTFDNQTWGLENGFAWNRHNDARRIGRFSGPTIIERQQSVIRLEGLDELAANFDVETPLVQQLIGMTGDNRKEVRAAVMDSLAAIGNFDFLVDFLNEEPNRNYWRNVLSSVRFYAASNRLIAEGLFDSLAAVGSRQQTIFKLIRGYSPEQLIDGGDRELVEFLDDPELALRVLAIDNLRTITNGLTYSYRPDADAKIRRRQIKTYWNRQLERELIRYVIKPEPPLLDINPPNLPEEEISASAEDQTDADESDKGELTNKCLSPGYVVHGDEWRFGRM